MKHRSVYRLKLAVCMLLTATGGVKAQELVPYKNPDLPVEVRVKDLLQRMTLEEKVDQLNMKSLNALQTDNAGQVTDSSLVRLFRGRSIGCLESPFVEHHKVALYAEAADHYLRTQTRLGIPAIQIAECLHGQMALGTTIFPQAIGLGSTWNPELIRQMASAIAAEASLSGVDQALSPLFDLARDPRYGWVEECYGEDPWLVKEMGVAFVTGMQGEASQTRSGIAEGKLACTAKHFVAYSVPEAGINLAPSLVGERTLRELHFVPFKAAVQEANVYSLMPGYHEVDGIPVHASHWLLTDVLRKEWGFGGYVFSDYGAVGMLDNFHYTAADPSESAVQALTAGVDLEAPGSYAYGHLENLVREGKVPEALVDSAVVRILRVKFKLGLFERPFHYSEKKAKTVVHRQEHVDLTQRIAEESVVLLKNQDRTLPLVRNRLKRIAVIGPNADKVQFGDYSITKNNDYGVTVLEGIRRYAGKEVEVSYAEGCGITSLSKDGFAEAARLARESDVVVLVLGGTSVIYSGIGWGDANSKEVNTCGEGYDRNELNFPGRLSVTFPPTTGHISMYANHKPSGKGYYRQRGTPQKPGRDYVFSSPDPLFCLGYGLSYTTFEYSQLEIQNHMASKGEVLVSCMLKNTGDVKGAEVVQLYVRDKISSVTTPVKALKGFSKVELNPGESRKVTLVLKKDDLKLWNAAMDFVLEPGDFEVFVGASVEDIRLKGTFKVE